MIDHARTSFELTDVPESRVDAALPEQVPDDCVVEAKEVRGQRRERAALIGDELDQVVPDEWRVRREMVSPRELRLGGRAQQVEGQIDARRAPRHVVLQERVDPAVAEIDLGRERDDDQVEIEARQLVGAGEATERRSRFDQVEQLRLPVGDAERGCDARALRPLRCVPVADVEATERIACRLDAVRGGDAIDGAGEDPVESLERSGEVGVRAVELGAHGNVRGLEGRVDGDEGSVRGRRGLE